MSSVTTITTTVATLEPAQLARKARLRYVLDDTPGFARQLNGKGFIYRNVRGNRLRSPQHLSRIEKLAIPPAWQEVWICPYPNGHLQVTGRDDKKRKQYIYHEHWQEASQLAKFGRIARFGKVLPKLRRQVRRDLRGDELSRKRIVAGMVALLDATSIRVGNEEYERQNGSYGLATLRTRHVTIRGQTATLRFRGKGGLVRETEFTDRALVKLLRQCKKVPGSRLFQWFDGDGKRHAATAADVNDYLHEHTGNMFTAKDFRTWKASAQVAGLLYAQTSGLSGRKRKRAVRDAIVAAAEVLGNTTTNCRRYYVHPRLAECFESGSYACFFKRFKAKARAGQLDEQILECFLNRCDA
jgi:DNA topoisomerase-1